MAGVLRRKPRTVLRIPVRRATMRLPESRHTEFVVKTLIENASRVTEIDLDTAARTIVRAGRQLARAGQQIGELAGELERAGHTTQRIGNRLAR